MDTPLLVENKIVRHPARPVRCKVIKPRTGWFSLNLMDILDYSEVLYFLVWRDILLRYKQTVLGAMWEVVKPLTMMIIYTIALGFVLRVSTDGVPYPLFFYSGALLWGFCGQTVAAGAISVVAASDLITKVYFPRVLIPTAVVLSALFDLGVASILMLFLMVFYKIYPTVNLLLAPLSVIVALLTCLGMSLFFSVLLTKYRDFQHVLSLLLIAWMFLTPVFYPVSLVPPKWQFLYSLNPMAASIEGFRWALFGKTDLNGSMFLIGSGMSVLMFMVGLMYFQANERYFPDWL